MDNSDADRCVNLNIELLLDTDVVSELRKVRAGMAIPRVAARAAGSAGEGPFLSVVAKELEIGVLQLERRDPDQGAILRASLEHHVLPAFADHTSARTCDPERDLKTEKRRGLSSLPYVGTYMMQNGADM